VTLDKSDHSFSPTTRYRDYDISPELFYWARLSIHERARRQQRYAWSFALGSWLQIGNIINFIAPSGNSNRSTDEFRSAARSTWQERRRR
jgi:hypothetical protein